jgi:hypothetical protein
MAAGYFEAAFWPKFLMKTSSLLAVLQGLCLVEMTSTLLAQNPTPDISSSTVPADVSIPTGFGGNPIAFFDDYSWRTFVALVWPAKNGQRGTADTMKMVGDTSSPLVFETYKADWEVFQGSFKGTSDPPVGGPDPQNAWQSYDTVVPFSNNQKVSFGQLALVPSSFSKFGNLGQAGFGNLVGPIVAQNKTYLRYLTAFNQSEFLQIFTGQLYLQAKLGNVTFPAGALDIKSSWLDMDNIAHPERYFKRQMLVFDPVSGNYGTKTMGLLGLHIVQKTPSRPQWIWSTFEQVDTVPAGPGPFSLNDGSNTPMPNTNPISFPPPATPATVFNVTRKLPIDPSTQTTNTGYQGLFAAKGAVWQFYRLVMTQWPVPPAGVPPQGPVPASQPGTPANTFPGNGATSPFSNVTMETFDQTNIKTGCMNCHNLTKQNTDFLWALKVNAFPVPTSSGLAHAQSLLIPRMAEPDASLDKLKALLRSDTHENNSEK